MEVLNNWKNKIDQILFNRDAKIQKISNILQLPCCTNLGFYKDGNNVIISWQQPIDISKYNIKSQWNKTILVRKTGSYPQNYLDGEIIATTSIQLNNKNYYKYNNYIDTYNSEYYYKLFSKNKFGNWNNLEQNQLNGTGLNWYQVQQYVRAGRGEELFPVGTVFYVNHPEYTHQDGTGIIFRVVGHDQVPTTNQNLTHSMCLQMVQCLFLSQYDAPQLEYYYTNDTTAQAGKTYYTYDGSNYTEVIEGTIYNIGALIPPWYQKNHQKRINYGSNNPKQNNLIQWANSEESAKLWFEKQNIWDQCGSVLFNKNGFMKYLDEDFKNVIQNANITRTYTDNGTIESITFSAKFFPLSKTQVTGISNENVQLTYYSQGGSAIKHVMDSEASVFWWLGSPFTSQEWGMCSVARIETDGTYKYNSYASISIGVSLACIIA